MVILTLALLFILKLKHYKFHIKTIALYFSYSNCDVVYFKQKPVFCPGKRRWQLRIEENGSF